MKKYALTSVLLLKRLAGAFAREQNDDFYYCASFGGRNIGFEGGWILELSAFRAQNWDPQEAQNRARRFAPRPILGFRGGVPILRAKSAEKSKIHHP